MKFNSQILKFSNSQIVFAVLVWALLILRVGYRFGTGDHVEYLPYVLFLNNHALYLHDYFLQGLQQKVPNERSVVCCFLSLFGNQLETACFILHFLTTIALVVGLQKLGKLITGSISMVRIAILINFFLLFDRGLGNVELYSDAVQGSSISVAIIALALYCFFSDKFIWSAILMSAASVIHPVEGLTVFMVLVPTLFVYSVIYRQVRIKFFIQFVFIYVITAGVFISVLLLQKFDGTSIPDNETFYKIYHEFRHAHHYVFAYFPILEKMLFVFFALALSVFTFSSNKKLFWFALFCLCGTLVYITCTDLLHIPQIANLQFYKTSQWIKYLGVLVLVKYISEIKLSEWWGNKNESLSKAPISLIVTVGACCLLFIKPAFLERPGIYHQYGNGWKAKDDMVEISMQVDKDVSKEAVFVQPFSTTELKYFGRASSWVDWKAFVKDQSKIEEWYRRIKFVYGIGIEDKEKGFELSRKADEHFYHLQGEKIEQLKKEGVTHLLTRKEFSPPTGKLILQNNTYAVYQL